MPDPFVCPSTTGPGPCMNTDPAHAEQVPPAGCVHYSTSGIPNCPKEEM